MGMLSPILNALKPQAFNIINSKPRYTLNYFCGADYANTLQCYPELNKLSFDFQEKHKEFVRSRSAKESPCPAMSWTCSAIGW